jgi:hypothetical protein
MTSKTCSMVVFVVSGLAFALSLQFIAVAQLITCQEGCSNTVPAYGPAGASVTCTRFVPANCMSMVRNTDIKPHTCKQYSSTKDSMKYFQCPECERLCNNEDGQGNNRKKDLEGLSDEEKYELLSDECNSGLSIHEMRCLADPSP